jgi:NADH:ubiquinone oxidoreductase subunit E
MKAEYSFLTGIGSDPGNLIKGLQAIQQVFGYISDEAILTAAEYFNRPVADVEGVVTFYAQFKRVKPGKYKIAVCDGTACHLKGAPLIHTWLEQEFGLKPGETTADGLFSLETVACLGCCSLAPVLSINGKVYGKLERRTMVKILKEYAANEQ